MAITVEQFGETDIQVAGTYISRLILTDATRDRAAQPITANPLSGFPRVTRSQQQGQVVPLHIEVRSGLDADVEALMATFRVGTTDVLIVDFDGTRRSLEATVQRVRPWEGSVFQFHVFLFAPDPRWRSELGQSDPLRAITASPTDFTITNDGTGIEDQARFYLRPYTLKSETVAQRYKFEIPIAWRANRAASNYPMELTDGGWDHATEVAAGRSLASGDDVRVLLNGVEIPRFDGGGATSSFDDALTKIWANLTFSSRQQAALRANATATSPANGEDLEVDPGGTVGWASSGFLKINNEVISYHGTTESNASGHAAFQNVARAQRSTTAASHTAADDLFFVEHRIQIMYGHTGAAPPPDWSAFEPLINRDTSTNSQFTWNNFGDSANPARSFPWLRQFTTRDSQSALIVAPTGAPDAVMDTEYSLDGAQADKPVANEWARSFPTGLRTSATTVAFVDSTVATATDATPLTVTVPTHVDGDILILAVTNTADATAEITTPAGWNVISDTQTSTVLSYKSFWREASSEPANYAITVAVTTDLAAVGVMAAYRNVDLTSPIMLAAIDNTAFTPPVVVPEAGGAAIAIQMDRGGSGTVTPDSRITERENQALDSGTRDTSMSFGDQLDYDIGLLSYTASGANRSEIIVLRTDSAMEYTATIGATLALQARGVTDDGSEVLASTLRGEQTAFVGAMPAEANGFISVSLNTRSQVIARNPTGTEEGETAPPVTAAYDTIAQQQFTAPATGKIDSIALNLDVDAISASAGVDMQIWSDDGSDAVDALLSEELTVKDMDSTGDDQVIVFTFTNRPTIIQGLKYWIRLKETTSDNFVGSWRRVATNYANGVSGVTGYTFKFQVRATELDQQSGAEADEGDTITVDDLTAFLETTATPSIVFAGSQGQDAYFLETKLRNLTTGIQEIALSRLLNPLDLVEIDIGERAIRNLTDGPLAVQTAGTVTFDAVASTPASSVKIEDTDGRVQIQSRYIDASQGWVVFRLKMGWTGGAATLDPGILFHWEEDANNFIQVRWDDTLEQWELQRRTTAGTAEVTVSQTIVTNDLITVIAKWDKTNVSLSIDGAAFIDAANTRFPNITAVLMELGSDGTSSSQIDSNVLWFACGKGTWTDALAADVDAFGDVDPDFDDFHADLETEAIWWGNDKTYLAVGFPRGPSIVGRHDEGQVFSDRARWLDLEDGANVIQLEETGLAGVNVDTRYRDVWE